MITETIAISVTDGMTRAASDRLRFLGATSVTPIDSADGEKSARSMVAQFQGGIPPRREPH